MCVGNHVWVSAVCLAEFDCRSSQNTNVLLIFTIFSPLLHFPFCSLLPLFFHLPPSYLVSFNPLLFVSPLSSLLSTLSSPLSVSLLYPLSLLFFPLTSSFFSLSSLLSLPHGLISLFSPNSLHRPLVSLLASLVSNHHLPESLGPLSPSPSSSTAITPSPSHTSLWPYPLRVQLLNFLVPSVTGSGEEGRGEGRVGQIGEVFFPHLPNHATSTSGFGSGRYVCHVCYLTQRCEIVNAHARRPSVSLGAHLLVSLTQRSCSVLQQPHLTSHRLPSRLVHITNSQNLAEGLSE